MSLLKLRSSSQVQMPTPLSSSPVSHTRTHSPPPRQPLAFYHELDPWQQDNHFIRSGYVKETQSYARCFKSLFYLHNETINIYSHLVPSCLVLAAVILYLETTLPMYDNYTGSWEKWNLIQFAVACTICLLVSSTFHCFKSHSLSICKTCNQLDYFGIVILITFSLNSVILFAFYNFAVTKWGFIALFTTLGAICTVLTLHPEFATPYYRPIRSTMFVLFGLSGLLPIFVGISLFGWNTTRLRAGVDWLVLEGALYIGGAVLYAMRIPERFTHVDEDEQTLLNKPHVGRFDIFGHSHQLFHIMVVIAAYCHWRSLLCCYHHLHQVTLVVAASV